MAQEIKFSLLYRDMWQSSGKYVPTVEQLTEVAPAIIDMGCFDRIETNGGGFEQINLLFGENPNKSVREWTQPFNDAGIQTHMLERGLNAIRMSPVPADVRRLMFHVKKKQGTDIARSFDGLNDPRNLENSIKYAKEAGMISQAALCITVSPVHTVEYYTQLADTLIEMGADEICIKDMAGVGRPASIGKIIKNIKARHPKTVIQYHGHAGPGFQMASILEAAYAGADYIDAGMEPLSWGTGHADILAIQAMLKDAGFNVPKINMNAYMKVRTLTQKYMDDFLGYYINPKNRMMNSLLIGPGLPGGMMGSLMSDLENNLASINKWKRKHNQNELTQDDLMIKLFEEVTYVWPKVGYPPLVTPYSQYVKNLALMNVLQLEKGKKRWSMIADNVWDMILGKTGKLPVDPAPEIIEMAKSKGLEFYTGNPQDLYPDQLDEYRAEMEKKNWDTGTALSPVAPTSGLIFFLDPLLYNLTVSIPPAIEIAKAKRPRTRIPIVSHLRNTSAGIVAPTQTPKNTVAVFIIGPEAASAKRAVLGPISFSRFPSISIPISGAADGTSIATTNVRTIGNKIFTVLKCLISYLGGYSLSCFFILIMKSSLVISNFATPGMITGTIAI
jgi:pyruvate carboxylase subunit B